MKKTGDIAQALKKYTGQKNKIVRVGFIDGAKDSNGTPVAQVAFWNEYGTKTSPPRPFFRSAITQNKSEWARRLVKLTQIYDMDKSLGLIGENIKGDIISSILETNDPPNSEVTALLKDRFPMNPQDITKADVYKAIRDVQNGKTGGNHRKPLVWTGDMVKRVSYEVVDDES